MLQEYRSHESGVNFVLPQLWDYQIAYTEYRLDATDIGVYGQARLYDGSLVARAASEGRASRSRPEVVASLERSLREHGDVWAELAER